MSFVLADTGPLFAAVDPGDQHHERAQKELRELTRSRTGVAAAWPTIFEAYTLIIRHLGLETAHGWLEEMLEGTNQVVPTKEDYETAAKTLEAYPDQPITLFDALTAVISTRLGCTVWTYDHHFDVMRTAVWRQL
jgi:predicted nucleic acid-binding protein